MKDSAEITERIRGFPFQMGLKRIQQASGSEISALLELRCCWMRSTGSWWNSIGPSSPSISTPLLSLLTIGEAFVKAWVGLYCQDTTSAPHITSFALIFLRIKSTQTNCVLFRGSALTLLWNILAKIELDIIEHRTYFPSFNRNVCHINPGSSFNWKPETGLTIYQI